MAVTLLVAVGSVLLVISGFTWAARREELESVQRIKQLRPTRLEDAAPGELTALRGRVGAGSDTVEDPTSGEAVVWLEARVVRRDRGEELWAKTEGRTLRFEDGEDGERTATVELVGAEIGLEPTELEASDRVPSETMKALLSSIEADVPPEQPTARYALERRALRVGDTLTLVGVPQREGEALRFTSRHPLYLTPEPLEALQQRLCDDVLAMDRMLKIGLALGIALIAGGVVVVVALG
ncbi:MAG: hypothetical protein KC619_27355 [Myxococcales bacterium]|nr:hypothetical protein [Myxococcales bacterium]